MLSFWTTCQVTPYLGVGVGFTHQDESSINTSDSARLLSYAHVDAAVYDDVSESLSLQFNLDNSADKLFLLKAQSTHQVTVGESINARFSINWRS